MMQLEPRSMGRNPTRTQDTCKKKRKKREQSSPIVKNLILAENLYEGFLVFQSAHALFGSRINLVIASRIRKLASLYII